MHRGVLILVSFVGVLLLAPTVAAQTTSEPNVQKTDPAQSELETLRARIKDLEQIIRFLQENLTAEKSEIQKRFDEAQLQHHIATFRQIQATYEWQGFASNVSLWIVVVIVIAGVAFSGFQLWHAAAHGQPQSENQLEISAKNFRLTSSVVGVVVLALSFFFFYLFVKEIYTIKPPFESVAAEQKPTP